MTILYDLSDAWVHVNNIIGQRTVANGFVAESVYIMHISMCNSYIRCWLDIGMVTFFSSHSSGATFLCGASGFKGVMSSSLVLL